MSIRPLCLVALWVAVGAVCLAPTLGAEESTADPAAFEKGLERIRTLHERRKSAAGLKALGALLEAHEGQPYARGRRAELEDLARRLAFRAACPEPDPKDLVSGKLLTWSPDTGRIKIQYEPDKCDDFRHRSGLYHHPARFCGPVTFEIQGARYPLESRDSPCVLFGGDDHPQTGKAQRWQINFGSPPRDKGSNQVWLPASITYSDGGMGQKVAEKEICPAKAGARYKLLVRVGRSSISAKLNGRSIGSAKKHKDVYGRFSFEADSWKKLVVSGVIEPAWIQSMLDEVIQRARAIFEAKYDRSKYLPKWLFAQATPAQPTETEDDSNDLPAELDPKHYGRLKRLYAALRKHKYEEVLEHVERLGEKGAPESICTYLAAEAYMGRGDLSKALASVNRSLALEPEFLDGRLMQGMLLQRLGRHAEALQSFEETTKLHPQDASAYEIGALCLLIAGRPMDARKVAQRAASHGVVSNRLDRINGALIKAVNGPTWNRVYEHKSRNYHVLSDISKKTCLEASKLLEEAFTSYRVNFGWVSRDKTKLFKVYLFSGRDGFIAYQADLAAFMGKPSEKAAGLYSPLLKQLLIWNLPSRDAMMETIRHEGFHQYIDRFLSDPPIWFNEGLAVYHENPVKVGGSLKFGQIHHYYLRRLLGRRLVPLKEFLFLPSRGFYGGGAESYARAWAFVHMLKHGESRHRALFKQLVKELQSGAPSEVLRRTFTPELMAKLDRELMLYIATLASK